MTEERAGELYDELILVADCVRDLGYPVDEPPSRQAYIDARMNGRLGWHPYSAVLGHGPNPAAQRELEDKCPAP